MPAPPFCGLLHKVPSIAYLFLSPQLNPAKPSHVILLGMPSRTQEFSITVPAPANNSITWELVGNAHSWVSPQNLNLWAGGPVLQVILQLLKLENHQDFAFDTVDIVRCSAAAAQRLSAQCQQHSCLCLRLLLLPGCNIRKSLQT